MLVQLLKKLLPIDLNIAAKGSDLQPIIVSGLLPVSVELLQVLNKTFEFYD